jgi:putative oxygen-independent coproporphyrinogen III oxidase
MPAGLYIHIPFCDARCHYCDFVTFADRRPQVGPYLKALFKEMAEYRGTELATLFVGGGTPSILTPEEIRELFSAVRENFSTVPLREVTVEANPESISPEKLDAFMEAGVNRLSFGLQTTKNDILADLGRLHSYERFLEVYRMARRQGIKNINVDLMYGLRHQDLNIWKQSLEEVIQLQPEHISAYGLKVEKGTRLDVEGFKADDDMEADMYLLASEKLAAAGYEHYEISNFSKRGFEGRHNLLYWTNADTIGVGLSATSYWKGRRIKNTTRLDRYIDFLQMGKPLERETLELPEEEKGKESLMLRLRLKKGIPLEQLNGRGLPSLAPYISAGLATTHEGVFSLTPRGWLLSNQIFQHFIS